MLVTRGLGRGPSGSSLLASQGLGVTVPAPPGSIRALLTGWSSLLAQLTGSPISPTTPRPATGVVLFTTSGVLVRPITTTTAPPSGSTPRPHTGSVPVTVGRTTRPDGSTSRPARVIIPRPEDGTTPAGSTTTPRP